MQDVTGKIIVSNTSGILFFDGVDWKMVPDTEGKRLFKLAADKNNRIYTGGDREIGYLKANDKGEMKFHSLLDRLSDEDREFGRITNVVSHNGDVYFRSKSHLLCYSNNVFKSWKPQEAFVKLVSSSAGLFVSEKTQWFQLQDETLQPFINETEEIIPNLRGVFEGVEDTLIIITKSQGLFTLANGVFTPIPIDLEQITIFNACEISANEIAIATNGNGVLIVTKQGILIDHFDESNGLNGNATTFPFFTDENLIVSMYSGIDFIEYPNQVSILDKKNGLSGYPLDIHRFNNQLFVGSNEGAYWIQVDHGTKETYFAELDGEFREINDATSVGNHLAVCNANGILVLGNKSKSYEIELITTANTIMTSKKQENVVFVGFQDKIVPIKIKEETYELLGEEILLPHLAYSMAENPNGDLWVASNGVSRIDYSNGFDTPTIFTLDSTNGLIEEMGFIELSTINSEVLFGTELGIYTYDESKNSLVPCKTFGKQFSDGSRMAYNLTEMRNGDVWVTTNHQTGLLRKQLDQTFIYDSLPLVRAPISDVWEIYEDDDNSVWICGTEALVKYDPSIEFDYSQTNPTFVRSVLVNNEDVIFAGNYSDENGFPSIEQPESYKPTLEFERNNITFKYGAAYYVTDDNYKLDYSVLLDGKDDQWSNWTKSMEMNYTNLREGRYTFKVRSKNIYGNVSAEAAYTFKILPPWYRTTWAYILFIVLGILALFLILKLNSLRLVREKRKLEGIVKQRTEEVRKQRDEITVQALELNHAYQRLVELDGFKEGMTSMIVHDLKNPLNAIINAPLETNNINHLKKIKQSGRQMLNMVLNILDVYKSDDAAMQINFSPVSASELVEHSLKEIEFLAQQDGIAINVNLKETADLNGDKEILMRILINILTNAIKFSPSMGLIDVKGLIIDRKFRFEIKDQGLGIEAEHIDSIFDQFKQIKKADSGGVRSTGLGLTFCKMAVEAHKGTIGVISEFGHGSNFWFEIPLRDKAEAKELEHAIENIAIKSLILSKDVVDFLTPYAKELEQIPYYKISTFREALQKIVPPENVASEVNDWLLQIKDAADRANKNLINDLIQKVLNEDREAI